jgi:hypothetical protein
VEHVEEKENDTVENNDVDHEPEFDDTNNHFVPPSPHVLQEQSHSIAANHPRRNIAPRKSLIEECNIFHYAMSCAKQVENDAEPATYTEVVASVDREKWISATQEEMQTLEKKAHGMSCACLNTRRLSAVSGYLKERKVYLLKSLRGLRQG